MALKRKKKPAFEHKAVYVLPGTRDEQAVLNRESENDWELVAVAATGGAAKAFYFKRPGR